MERGRLSHGLNATRTAESTVDLIPMQGLYLEKHEDRSGGAQRRNFRFEAMEPEETAGGQSTPPPMARFPLTDFRPLDQRWAAPFHDPAHPPSLERRPFRSPGLVYEDGKLLSWIVSEPAIVKERPGSFFHGSRFVHFSTTDGSDPRGNGRRYEIAFPDLSGWLHGRAAR